MSGLIGITTWALAVIVVIAVIRLGNIFRYIPNNQVGIVEKMWAAKGSIKTGFIALHGEAGFQPEILRGGIHAFFPFTYRIHKSDLVTVGQGKIAYVFARDGAPLGPSQVLASNDSDEKSDFQDARKFLTNGGQKGPQRKILREGTYAINATKFAIITDELVYGHALSKQEQAVLDGMKQLAGKYAFNTYAGKVEVIPTVNFILKWVRGEVGAMKLDENLSEISLITKDAFEPTLPLSVVMHIDYKKAPMIIQRFGDVKKLVEQTLDPMVSAYFKKHWAKDDADRAAAEPRGDPGRVGERDEGQIHSLLARAARGFDRHAARAAGRSDDREYPDPATLASGRARADHDVSGAGEGGRPRANAQ